jgi:HAE1 family hydrophobic/amphiphilic exporter-1
MRISHFFIDRPIFAAVISIVFVILGGVSFSRLPVAQYPEIAPPIINVSGQYPGASADVVASTVVTPIEQQINGVEGMHYMTSTNSNDGTSTINVVFRTGYDLNIAAVDVQNRVATAQGRLPQEIKNTGVTITKANPNFVFAAGFFSPDNSLSNQYISNYLDVYVKDALKRIPGVGDALIFGERKYAMRVWLDPTRLAARQLTAADVVSALQEQNVEIPAGQLGRPPADPKQDFQVALRVVGRLSDPREFENIILKNTPNGIIQLKDVGRAEIGAESYDTNLMYSGHDAIGVGVQQLSNANALDVDKAAKAELEELSKSFPPGMKYVIAFDTTTVVGDSVKEVVTTLEEAILIVIIVIFLFLLDWRATIIPAVTIPVSLIGTFAFIKMFGFSINSLTLFGITLATGLVVDDAIVVIENAQRHIDSDRTDSHTATSVAMAEVASAVVATSLVLISVFVPVSFFPGTTGILYRQFSLTIAFSIAISLFNALTLSPALAALLLRGEEYKYSLFAWTRIGWLTTAYEKFVRGVETAIRGTATGYGKAICRVLKYRYVMIVLFLVGLAATAYMYRHVPTGFVPQEDQNYFIVVVQAPPGASLSYTTNIARQAEQILRADPDVFGTFAVPGFSLSGGSSPNYGLVFAPLKPIDDRKAKGHAASDIVARVSPKLFSIPGAIVVAFEPPAVNGIGSFGGFQFQLQDLGRNTLQDLDTVAHKIVVGSHQRQDLTGLFTSFTANDPQQLVEIDREKAKAMAVPINQVTQALGVYMGSEYVNDFDFNNRSYRVYVQADLPFRMSARDLRQYYVRSDTNGLVPLGNIVSLKETSGPQVINHFNLFRSAEIDGAAAPGYSSSQGLQAMEELAKQNMLQGMSFNWSGLALEEVEAGGKAIIIFALGLLVVYLTLSAQYESFVLPFIILLAVPMAVLGALLFISARGFEDDVYVQIGLVMLIGLSAKNSILIVEFAEQLIGQGRTIINAAIEAAELRLRPILMTSFAFILGVLPLYFASGAGKIGRHSVGTAIVGGMLFSTVLNLFFIPVLYVIVKTVLTRLTRRREPAVRITEEPEISRVA